MFIEIWNFITQQFAFSQTGASQSWLFWVLVLVIALFKKCWWDAPVERKSK